MWFHIDFALPCESIAVSMVKIICFLFCFVFYSVSCSECRNCSNVVERSATQMDTQWMGAVVAAPPPPSPVADARKNRKNRSKPFHCSPPASHTWDSIFWWCWDSWINCCSNRKWPPKRIETWVIVPFVSFAIFILGGVGELSHASSQSCLCRSMRALDFYLYAGIDSPFCAGD